MKGLPSLGRVARSRILWPIAALLLLLAFNYIAERYGRGAGASAGAGFFHIEMKNGRLYGSLIDIVNRAVPVILLSLGMTLVIATAGVDLSVGAVMAIAGTVSAVLLAHHALWVVIALALASGAACGLVNGVLVGFVRVQPIVATLILMVAGRGIAQLLCNGQIIAIQHPGFAFIGGGFLFALPFPITIVVIAIVLTILLTRFTALGLFIESIGGNEGAVRYSGIDPRPYKTFVYAFSGLCAAMAGIIATSDIKAADANNVGLYLELDAILSVAIGGTSLMGGRFFLVGSVIGALLIQSLTTTILSRGVPVEYTFVVKAIVIILVCLVQSEHFRAALRSVFPRRAS